MRASTVAALAWLAMGCAKTGSTLTPVAVEKPAATPRGMVADDAEVAGALATIHMQQYDLGKLALRHTSTPEVRDFAERMVREHGDMAQEVDQLVRDHSFPPESSVLTDHLRVDDRALRDRLEPLAGPSFDRAYADAMIDVHRRAIDYVDEELLPAVSAPDLRALIERQRATLLAESRDARLLVGSLQPGA